jgi:SAM-dependent methyltransferase
VSAQVQQAPDAVSYWNDAAVHYDGHYDVSGPRGYSLRVRMEAVLAALGSPSGRVLDAGMGSGRLCAELAAAGWEPSGVDPAEGMVALARRRLPSAGDRLVVGRLEALPFAAASFDAVVATGSLEYADLARALDELSRVLRPGGHAVVTYPYPYACYALWKTRLYYPLIRGLKRIVRRPHPDLPRGFPVCPPSDFGRRLSRSGLTLEATTFTSYSPLLTPLDSLLPSLSVSLAVALEQRALAPKLFSTQVVYAARKGAS